MANLGETRFTIRAVDRSQQAFSQIARSLDRIDRKCGRLGSLLQNKLAPSFAAAFAGGEIVNTITKFERLEASLRTVTGSAERAENAFRLLQDFTAKTPFQLEETTNAFIKLKALGLTPSEKALHSYGNTAIAIGKSLNQMIEAVADATTGEFERLKEFGIKARTHGEQVTFTFQGVSKTVAKNAAEIEAYLQSIGNVQFAGAIEEKVNTLVAAISKMKNAFSMLVKAIGDAGLTNILIAISWLVEKITSSIDPIKFWCMELINQVTKFGNLFIAVFKGIGDAFTAFVWNISGKFEALGKDLAAFIEDPLNGVSFENTKKALEIGLTDSMNDAFNKAIDEARNFNNRLDAELYGNRNKGFNDNKYASLEDVFAKEENKSISKKFHSSYRPSTNENSKKLTKESKDNAYEIDREFEKLGNNIEDYFTTSLGKASSMFNSFGDFAKHILHNISNSLISNLFKGSNVGLDTLGGSIGNMFGGFFADGGRLSPGKFGIVGEDGPELAFAGNTPLNIMPSLPSSNNVTINMNVQTNDIGSFRRSGSQIAADIARHIERAKRNM